MTDSVDRLEIYCEGSWIVLRKYAGDEVEDPVRAVSVTRRVDELGRVLIPKEVRRTLGITDTYNDLEFFTREDGCILLSLSIRSCCFCGGTDGLKPFRGKLICEHCRREIAALDDPRD